MLKKRNRKQWLLLGGLAVLLVGWLATLKSFRAWQRNERVRIQRGGIVVETACGPVEYQVTGQGAAVLYAHGTPGGYDQGIAFARYLAGEGGLFIAPSRPGYLRTPLTSGVSPEAQADLYAALLDELGIARASIIGFSGGGPSALQFALRHPERCRSLVIMGGVIQRNNLRERWRALPPWQRLMAFIVEYLLVSDLFIYLVLPITRLLPQGAAVSGMFCSGTVYDWRRGGYENDLYQFAGIGDNAWEKISAPTLIVHGSKDEDAPIEDARLLAGLLPRVKLLALEGDHSAFYTQGKQVWPLVRDYLHLE